MNIARLRLTIAGETMSPPRAPFFLKTWGTSRFPTPPPRSRGGDPPVNGPAAVLAVAKDVLASEEIDEIVVSTHPETRSGWLRENLVEEVRKATADKTIVSTFPRERSGWLRRDLVGRLRSRSRLPVEHVIVQSELPGMRQEVLGGTP